MGNMWYTQLPSTIPTGRLPVCISVQNASPERSDVKGRPLGARWTLPPLCLIAVPIAMNSAMSEPHS